MNLPFDQKRKPFRAASFSKICRAILVGAVSLCFVGSFAAMAPSAFAQRGGGHVGGGGGARMSGGGDHVGMGGSFRPAGGSGYGGIRVAGAGASTSGSRTTNRGYGRTYFVPPASRSGASSTFVRGSSTTGAAGARAFAASNHIWEAPPGERPATMRRVANPLMNARFSNASELRPGLFPVRPARTGTPFLGATATPFNSLRGGQGFGPCAVRFSNCGFFPPFFNNPFFFGNPFFGVGFGFNSCFAGGFGCFGFDNFGFGPFGMLDEGYGLGYGYGNGWFYPPAPEASEPPVNPTEENQPPDYSANYYFVPAPGEAVAESAQPQQPVVKLVLKDGTIFGVYSYWMQNNQLFYITTYNIKTSIPIDDLDVQKTVDLNAKLGMKFDLTSKPPDQQQQEQQPDQQQ